MGRKRNVPRICEGCGVDFLAETGRANQRGGRYCSLPCANTHADLPLLPPSLAIPSEDGKTARVPLYGRDGGVRAYALIDADDAEFVSQWRWHLNSKGYAVRSVYAGGGHVGIIHAIYLHRELLGLARGDGVIGDHKHGNRLDCRRSLMRTGSKPENAQNRLSNVGSSSKYRGVSWHKRIQKWMAKVTVSGIQTHLGYFTSEEEAARVAREYRIQHLPFSVES